MMKNLRKMYKSLRITKGREGNLRTCVEREKKMPVMLRCCDEWRKQMREMKREN
jgi:predicted RNA-binding protein